MYNIIIKLASSFLKLANEAYEEFRDRVERLSRENPYPFKDWFDANGRTYIDFQDYNFTNEDDKYVISLLEEEGWDVIDYKGGYAQKNNRKMKIGKIFNQIKRETKRKYELKIQEAQQKNADEFELDAINKKFERDMNFIDDSEQQFINSPARSKKEGDLMIVISQNPHDVASMSTGRSWESCMTLGSGGHHQDVYCEVARGGLVAYLINKNDKNITNPYARIHIRRFDSKNGHSIAVPEKSVYGNDVQGFLPAVENWIASMQQNFPIGHYKRKGGKWSDTFSDDYFVTPNIENVDAQKQMIDYLKGENLPEDLKYKTYVVTDMLYDEYGDDDYYEIEDRGGEFDSLEEAQTHIMYNNTEEADHEREMVGDVWSEWNEDNDNYEQERYKINEVDHDNTYSLQQSVASSVLNSPKESRTPELLQALKEFVKVDDGVSPLGLTLLKEHPEIFSKEEVSKFDQNTMLKYIDSLPDDKKELYTNDLIVNLNNILKDPNGIVDQEDKTTLLDLKNEEASKTMIPGYDERAMLEGQIYIKFNDLINKPLRIINRIPEELVQNLINFSRSLKDYGLNPTGSVYKNINDSIYNNLSKVRADTPVVQNYYNEQLLNWNNNVDNISLLRGISSLGENGKRFLPFLKEKLEELKQKYYDSKKDSKKYRLIQSLKKQIERILYTIDSIESGKGRSDKYNAFLY